MRRQYPDAVVLPGATALPGPSGRTRVHKPPVSLPAIGIRLARGLIHQLRKANPDHHERPQLNVATQDARWFLLCKVDGVTVTTADGRGVVYRQRDRAKMFALLRASLRQHIRLARKYDRMRQVYREALPVLSSQQKWETVLLDEVVGRCLTVSVPTPAGEVAALVAVQSTLATPPVGRASPGRCRTSASTLPAGWRCRRSARCSCPAAAATGCWSASAPSPRTPRRSLIKLAVRRQRPHHPDVAVNVGTPSALSFPSAHATSTTAAAMLLCRATRSPLPLVAGAADGAVAAGARCALPDRRARRDGRRRRGRAHGRHRRRHRGKETDEVS